MASRIIATQEREKRKTGPFSNRGVVFIIIHQFFCCSCFIHPFIVLFSPFFASFRASPSQNEPSFLSSSNKTPT